MQGLQTRKQIWKSGLVLLAALTGCGGGSSSVVTPVTGTRAALTGTVTAQSGGRADALTPVSGATCTLTDVATGTTVGTPVTTDAQGVYAFPALGTAKNYRLSVTKTDNGRTLRLSAIVTKPQVSSQDDAPKQQNVDPLTTVAEAATTARSEGMRANGSDLALADLEALADDLEAKRRELTTAPPDCTNATALAQDTQALEIAAAPSGSYLGSGVILEGSSPFFDGGKFPRFAAQVDHDGNCYMTAVQDGSGRPHNDAGGNGQNGGGNGNQNGDHQNGNSGGNSSSNGGNGDNQNGNGSQGGGNGDNHPQDSAPGDIFLIGHIDAHGGFVTAPTADIPVLFHGTFTSGIGVGTWELTDGSAKGSWRMDLLKGRYSGLYVGVHRMQNHNNSRTRLGNYAVLVIAETADPATAAVIVIGDNNDALRDKLDKTTTLLPGGTYSFTLPDSMGGTFTMSGSVNPEAHRIEGTYTTSGGAISGSFVARSNTPISTDL